MAKINRRSEAASTEKDFVTRTVTMDAERALKTIDEKGRTVEAVVATEEPVQVLDWNRWEIIDEILLMDGAEIPKGRQVPLLDSHSRQSTQSIKGSARELTINGAEMRAKLHFSSTAEDEWTLVREGHLTDVSAGYRISSEESVFIEPGQEAVINGRSFKNKGQRTLVIRKKWSIKEVSTTPIGADDRAKMRTEAAPGHQAEQRTTPNKGEHMPNEKPLPETQTPNTQPGDKERTAPALTEQEINGKARARAKELLEKGRKIEESIRARAQLLQLGDAVAEEIRTAIDMTADDAEQRAIDMLFARAEKNKTSVPPKTEGQRIQAGTDDLDKFRTAAVDSLCHLGGIAVEPKALDTLRQSRFYGMGLLGTCRAYLEMRGVPGAGWMAPALVYDECVKLRAISAQGSGDFASVFADVANKSLAKGWNEAGTTYQVWTGKDSIPNFMTKNIVRISNLGDAQEILEGDGFPFSAMADSKETAQLKTYGLAYSLSRKAIINDSISSLTQVPAKLTQAIRRHINRAVYDKLYGTAMAGPTMTEDSVAMFSTTHVNFDGSGSGAAPSLATLATGRNKLRKLKLPTPDGSQSNTQYTAIDPKFIIFHSDQYAKVHQFLQAQVAQDNALMQSYPFVTQLTPIDDPVLDELMDTLNHEGWYLIASPQQQELINVFNLTGYEVPTLRNKVSDVAEPLGTTWDIYYDYIVAAADWRGGYANYGK